MIEVKRYQLTSPEKLHEAISKICEYLEMEGYEKPICYSCSRSGHDCDDGFFRMLGIEEFKELKELQGVVTIETEKYYITLGSASVSYFETK